LLYEWKWDPLACMRCWCSLLLLLGFAVLFVFSSPCVFAPLFSVLLLFLGLFVWLMLLSVTVCICNFSFPHKTYLMLCWVINKVFLQLKKKHKIKNWKLHAFLMDACLTLKINVLLER
jgi:hypothetical protein